MKTTIQVNRYLTKYFNYTGELKLELEENATVRDLLSALKDQFEVEIIKNIASETELRRYFIVVIDGKFAMLNDQITGDEKEIKLIPPISGG